MKNLKKLLIFLFMFCSLSIFAELQHKLVIDYGNFLNIEAQKELHTLLEKIYQKTKVHIILVTVDDENKYNINKSILDYSKEVKELGIEDNIVIIRTKNTYKIYFIGNINNSKVKNFFKEDILNEYIKYQSNVNYYITEFEAIIGYLNKAEIINTLLENNELNKKKKVQKIYKNIIILILLTIILIIIIFLLKRRAYMKKIGAKF